MFIITNREGGFVEVYQNENPSNIFNIKQLYSAIPHQNSLYLYHSITVLTSTVSVRQVLLGALHSLKMVSH